MDVSPNVWSEVCPEVSLEKRPWTKFLHVNALSRIVQDFRFSHDTLSELFPDFFVVLNTASAVRVLYNCLRFASPAIPRPEACRQRSQETPGDDIKTIPSASGSALDAS